VKLVPIAHPHRRALFVLLALLVAAGVHAGMTSGRSIYPRVSFARIAVIAESGERPVRAMLASTTRPLEQAVAAIDTLRPSPARSALQVFAHTLAERRA